VGTEVSAKFKGAFCEAKIKRVEKCVKCKVTYKISGEQATLSDELLKNANGQALQQSEFKIGSLVYVMPSCATAKNSNATADISSIDENQSQLQTAILNKIIDQSSYTVIFNDGDEKTLKRNFVRFKGEKHFLDSETLNNAPLNNPEHFLYPIKQSNEQTTTATTITNTATGQSEDCLKQDNNEILKDQSKLKLNDDKVKDSKEDSINRDVIDSSQKEEDYEDEEDDESEESSDDSDEYTSEEKDRFVAKLYSFMDDRGTPMNKVPSLNNQDLDLHKFFMVVKKFGGFNKV
jgi:hypothetical protein